MARSALPEVLTMNNHAAALLVSFTIASTFSASATAQQRQFAATLEGHALLDAATFIKPPADAPVNLAVSGRFLHADGRRRDAPRAIPGIAFLSDPKVPRSTGMSAPFQGQPVQGFSGIKWRKDGTAWIPSDNGFVRKVGYFDLLDIADPKRVARLGGANGKFAFPHWCIEGIDIVDAEHIVVLNENNLLVSQAREFGKNEPNEMILLKVPELMNAK